MPFKLSTFSEQEEIINLKQKRKLSKWFVPMQMMKIEMKIMQKNVANQYKEKPNRVLISRTEAKIFQKQCLAYLV